MPINDFIGFASAGSANVMSQADYVAAAEQTDGVQPGMASSALANKVWRQGANMASALGRIAVAQGLNALDNGDIGALTTSLSSALLGSIDKTNNFIKLPIGLMVATVYFTDTTDSNSRVTWTYPEAFIADPTVSVLKTQANYSFNIYSLNNTRIILRCNDMSGSTIGSGQSVTLSMVAIGRYL